MDLGDIELVRRYGTGRRGARGSWIFYKPNSRVNDVVYLVKVTSDLLFNEILEVFLDGDTDPVLDSRNSSLVAPFRATGNLIICKPVALVIAGRCQTFGRGSSRPG